MKNRKAKCDKLQWNLIYFLALFESVEAKGQDLNFGLHVSCPESGLAGSTST